MTLEAEKPMLGSYRLLAALGQGGMADVFLAVVHGPAGFNTLRVVKRLRPHLVEVPEMLTMFLDEARLAAGLNHPNIVHTLEIGEEAGEYFIAMEYLDGQPLHRILHRAGQHGGLSLEIQLSILVDVLAGLHYAHEAKNFEGTDLELVHRDVSPHNVFVTYEGQVKIVDFGIAKAANSSSETRAGVIKGKVSYMPPEQALGAKVDRRADLFAVGVMLWEAITGSRMWKGVPEVEMLQRLVKGDIPRATSVNPDIPEKLAAICDKATAANVEDRFATAEEMQLALEGYLEEAGARVKMRDIGATVSDLFKDKRETIKSIIEKQLRRLADQSAASPVSGPLPRLDRTISAAGSVSAHSVPTGTTDSAHIRTPSGALSTSSSTLPSVAPPRPRERSLLAAAGLALACLAGGGAWIAARASHTQPQPSVQPAPTGDVANHATQATAAPLPSGVEPAVAQLKLRAEPAAAKIYLDGVFLDGNPYAGTFPQDGAQHQVRVEAEGFVTQSRFVALDKSVVEETFSLERQPPKSRPAHKKTSHASPPKPPQAPTAAPSAKSPPPKPAQTSGLDQGDPWK